MQRYFNFIFVFGKARDRDNLVNRSSPPELFLGKVLLKMCSKFTGEHPCRSVIPIKLLCKLRCFLYKNTSGELLLNKKLKILALKDHVALKLISHKHCIYHCLLHHNRTRSPFTMLKKSKIIATPPLSCIILT